MKKLKFIFKMLLFAALVAPWASCSKSDDNAPDDGKDKDPYMEVCEHVCDIAKQVKNYYKQSNNIAELASYAEEIKSIEYVNDVYFSTNTMYVDILDYGTISYSFFPVIESENKSNVKALNNIIEGVKTRSEENGSPGTSNVYENAIVINQQHKDESRQWARDFATVAEKAINSCGIKCTPNTEPSLDFFKDGMADYDIILFITHGEWDPVKKLHWLLTSETPSMTEEDFNANDLYKYKGIDRDQVSLSTVYETRNGKDSTLVTYVKISEKYIKEVSTEFKNKGNAIFFCVACQSLMGGGLPKEEDGDRNERNYSLAKILKNKGIGFYLGYDEYSSGHAQRAGMLFFWKLASGMSLRNAYESLPDECLHNHNYFDNYVVYDDFWHGFRGYYVERYFIADLLPYPSYLDGDIGISNNCITSPVFEEYTDNSSEIELNLILKATSPLYYDLDYIKTINSSFEYFNTTYINDLDYSKFRYGFEYSTNENFTDAKKTEGMAVNTKGCSFANNKVSFTQTLTSRELKSNTIYYYRAYFYDGYDYNYSKSDYFKTRMLKGSSGTTISDVPGTDF